MQCRVCGVEARCQTRADLTYYECPRCAGLWFNQGELEAMISRRIAIAPGRPLDDPSADTGGEGEPASEGARAAPPSGHGETGDCPVCGPGVRLVSMTTYATRHVRVLGCPVCFGHWLSRKQALVLVDRVCYPGFFGSLRRLFRRPSS